MGLFGDIWSGISGAATSIWDAGVRPGLDAVGLGDVADGIEDATRVIDDGIQDVADDVDDAVNEIAEDVAEGLEDLGEAFVDAMVEVGEGLDEAFSKDGWMTQFVEDYLPGGGFVTAAVHAAAGNEDYAKMAAVKGAVTTIEAATSIAGTMALGPAGGVLGAGIGNAMGQLLEQAVRDELPESVRHLIPENDALGVLTEVGGSMLGGAAGSAGGKAFGAAKRGVDAALKKGAKELAEEAAEKTTAQLIQTAIMKKYLTSPIKRGVEAALDEAGIPVSARRGVPSELLEKLEITEQQLTMAALANERLVRKLSGATESELIEFDQQIFTAKTRMDQLTVRAEQDLESRDQDEGQFYSYENERLGTYYMRNGVVVWELEDLDEANKEIELDNAGMTEQELQESIARSWESRHRIETVEGGMDSEHPDWSYETDPILGTYMVRDGEVIFGVDTPEEAQRQYGERVARDRGFATLDEYRDELVTSWKMANEYAVEAGNATGEWQTGGQSDVVGDYMIKDGQIVWGASDPDEAEAMLPEQLARDKGFESVDALRDEIARSWKLGAEYDAENGYATDQWQTGQNTDIVGPYMIKDGVVVWGVDNEEQAEEYLPTQIAVNQGFSSVDEARDQLIRSWQAVHDNAVENGTANGEWVAGGQSAIHGPYMVKDGEIAFGATTPEEADAILANLYAPIDEEPVLSVELPVDEDGNPILEVDEDGNPVLPVELPVDENGNLISEDELQDLELAELRAQIAELQEQLKSVTELLVEQGEQDEEIDELIDVETVMPDNDDDDDEEADNDEEADDEADGPSEMADDDFDAPAADAGADDEADDEADGSPDPASPGTSFDDFDDFDAPPTLPKELPVDEDGNLVQMSGMGGVADSNLEVTTKPAGATPAAPVVEPDPMDWTDGAGSNGEAAEAGEPELIFKPAVMADEPSATTEEPQYDFGAPQNEPSTPAEENESTPEEPLVVEEFSNPDDQHNH